MDNEHVRMLPIRRIRIIFDLMGMSWRMRRSFGQRLAAIEALGGLLAVSRLTGARAASSSQGGDSQSFSRALLPR